MPVKNIVITISLVFMLFFNSSATAAKSKGVDGEFVKVDLPQKNLNLSKSKFGDCWDLAVQIKDNFYITTCNNNKIDTKNNYGARLLLVKIVKGKPVIKYRSHGYMDGYGITPTFFRNQANEIIVWVDTGAEYSWGATAYLFNGVKIKELGDVRATYVKDPDHGQEESIAPYAWIYRNNGQIIIRFTKDPLYEKNGKYMTVPAEKVKYIYNGKKLREVISK